MAIPLQDLIDIACLQAGVSGIKRGIVAELLVPRVLTWVSQRAAADPNRRALVTSTNTISLVNGAQSMPATALTEFMEFSAVSDPLDATMARKMRWIPKWSEFIRPLDQTLGYYTVQGTTFRLTRPGAVYTPGVGMTGNVELTVPSRIIVSMPSESISAAPEIEQEIIMALTAALSGNLPFLATEAVK